MSSPVSCRGAALANAGAASDNEAVKTYAEALLTDTTGKKSNAQIAREFDAAMNPAGTLGVFTTAKDRSTELRDAVRAHAGNGTANGLWAQVTGGKTKLKGISTLKTVESTLSQIRRRRARGTSGLWPSSP